MIVWLVSDGKPGHLNQSRGVIAALKKRTTVEVLELNLAGKSLWQSLKLAIVTQMPRPDLVLGAGHKTHIPIWIIAHRFKAISCVCMKPSLPTCLFDICFVPYHDLAHDVETMEIIHERRSQGVMPKKHIYPTLGALHRIVPALDVPKVITLVLVGGPSKLYDWDTDSFMNQLHQMVEKTTGRIVLTTSRRTPLDVVKRIREEIPEIELYPVEKTDSSWVPNHLKESSTVWVTEDSVSMLFEALGSGSCVGIFSVPTKGPVIPRMAASVNLMRKEGYVSSFNDWLKQGFPTRREKVLSEADDAVAYLNLQFPQLFSVYE